MIVADDIIVAGQEPVDAAAVLAKHLCLAALKETEHRAGHGVDIAPDDAPAWDRLARRVRETYRHHDHVIVRSLDPAADPRTLMAVAGIVGTRFLTYGDGKIVRSLTMNPWSRALAHTAREGWFHTDLNASPAPPAITAIQCIEPDPGAPDYGLNRVSRLPDLLRYLADSGEDKSIAFLTEQEVEMANSRSPGVWRGRIIDGSILRFHPETVRAAAKRRHIAPPEDLLDTIQRAAMATSRPIDLGRGDILLLSNHRTLHYRGECSVRFTRFPLEYDVRRIHMLNMRDERS